MQYNGCRQSIFTVHTTSGKQTFCHCCQNVAAVWSFSRLRHLPLFPWCKQMPIPYLTSSTIGSLNAGSTAPLRFTYMTTAPLLSHPSLFVITLLFPLDDRQTVTCAGDCTVRLHDVTRGVTQLVHRHRQRAKKLVVHPSEPQVVLSCSEDGTGGVNPVQQCGIHTRRFGT